MRILSLILILLAFSLKAEAYKVFSYNNSGEREYRTISQDDIKRCKKIPRRAYIRQPRENWEITKEMRARKMTSSQYTHRN